jgi:hypothetical protein
MQTSSSREQHVRSVTPPPSPVQSRPNPFQHYASSLSSSLAPSSSSSSSSSSSHASGRGVYLIQFLHYLKTLGDFIVNDPIGHASYLQNLNASPRAILSNLVYAVHFVVVVVVFFFLVFLL